MNCPYAIVANPFSNKNWTRGLHPEHDLHNRFEYDIPPARNEGKLAAKNVKDRLRDRKGDPDAALDGENDRVSQALTGGRIKRLAEHYASPPPRLPEKVETWSSRVDEHLKKMGFAW